MERHLINISEFPQNIFWNYKPGSELDESIVIENVILYGELKDLSKLLKLVSLKSIENVVDNFEKKGKYKKRTNFIKKVILA